jgi:Ca2+-transporting ATPase
VTDWYRFAAAAVVERLGTDPDAGLTASEAARRLAEHGRNELEEHGFMGPWRILLEQLSSALVVVLIVAAGVSAALGDVGDAVAILAIVVLNSALGVRQEYRAERAVAALQKLAVPEVRLRRDGHLVQVPATEVVPGDLLTLEAGDLVSADGRLLDTVDLQIQEASLTGESEAVEKSAETTLDREVPPGDRVNMVHRGTLVTYGRGTAVVTATGMETEIGRIATLIQGVAREATPLERRLDRLGRNLAVAALALVAVIFTAGLLRGEELKEMFLTAVSLAVAAVPEGLPAVVTIALSLGAQRMLARNALIRKLPAVETLGSVTVICSDKTGTLTRNRMSVAALFTDDRRWRLDEDGEPAGSDLLLLALGAVSNDAEIEPAEEGSAEPFRTVGDPTETALLAGAARRGLVKPELEAGLPRERELPFDSERKRMSTVHRFVPSLGTPELERWREQLGTPRVAVCKGALEGVLDRCRRVWHDGAQEPLDDDRRRSFLDAHDRLADDGMRVLAVAFRGLGGDDPPAGELEDDLTLLGLVGLIDPPRPQAAPAIATCRRAGIRPLMITGDHPRTARAIARRIGLDDDGEVLTGVELGRLSGEELEAKTASTSIYARVSPEHKLRLIDALQRRGQVVAMTGDGVNDAPALKKADIGVAMGRIGTDVAREAADAVLRDDNFATIVAAVEEGRRIYGNVRKFIQYTLSSNIGELWVMFLAPFLGMPLPLLPLQILWVNLVTDGLPGLALGLEPVERDAMRRPPYSPRESIFSRGLGWDVLWLGLVMGGVSLAVGFTWWGAGRDSWQTLVFTTLTLSQLLYALTVRSRRTSFFTLGPLSNKPLLAAVALTFALQLAVVYLPFLQRIFHTVPLTAGELGVSLAVSSIPFACFELAKRLRGFSRRRGTGS